MCVYCVWCVVGDACVYIIVMWCVCCVYAFGAVRNSFRGQGAPLKFGGPKSRINARIS